MKKTLIILSVLAVLMLSSVAAFTEEECDISNDKWACIKTNGGWDHKDFMTTGRYGDNLDTGTWELAIKDPDYASGEFGDPEHPVDQDNYVWDGWVEFSVSYNPTTGLVTYELDDEVLTWTYDTDKAFDYVTLMGKAVSDNEVEFDALQLNGDSVTDFSAVEENAAYRYHLSDDEQCEGFELSGYVNLAWEGNTQNEIPGFHVFAMNTHDLDCEPDIPEFTVIGAVAVLGLAGLFIVRRRK